MGDDAFLGALCARLAVEAPKPRVGVDWALPIFEALAGRSTVVLLKVDGERDMASWTIVLSGGVMGDDYFRNDGDSVETVILAGLLAVAARI